MRSLPSIVSKLPNDLRQFLERVREKIDQGGLITRDDLIAAGIASPGRGGALRPADGSPIIPPAPIDVSATGAMTSVFVEFEYPQYSGHAYAEIWRAEVNDLGQAQLVGQTPGKFYSDAVGGATVRWYWVRLVSVTDTVGPFNSTSGTRGETAPDPAYLLEQLAGSITETQLYADLNSRIDLIDGNQVGSVNYRILQEEQARVTAIAAEAVTRAQAVADEASARSAGDVAEATTRAQAIAGEASARVAAIQGEADARNAAIAQEAYQRIQLADENAEAVLRSALTIHAELTNRAEDIALARFELNENLQAGLSAEASARLVLAAAVSDNAASILNEQTARATADDAIASDLSNLAATVGSNTAAIQNEATARADGDSAEATQRNLLAVQMRGNYTGSDLAQVNTGLLYQERIARVTQDQALAQQITLLSAGAGEQFDWKTIWYFDEGVEGWAGNGTPTVANGWLRPANQATSAYVASPTGIAADGNQYGQVRLRIRKTGSPVFAGYLWWQGVGDSTWDASRRVALTEPTYDANGIGLVTVSPIWSVEINRIRIDLSDAQAAGDYFEIDWVAIGRPSPGASSAQLLDEQTARATADAAEVAAREALSAKITGVTDPAGVTLGTLASGLLFEERQARVTQDTAIASSVTSLQATVTNNFNTLNSAITTEQTARANADSAEVSARQALSTKMTGLADPTSATLGTLSSGLIFDERQARSTADSAIASDLSVLSSTVTTNHSTAMGAITTEATTRAEADAANASQITSLVATTRDLSQGRDSNAWAILENVLAGDKASKQTRDTLAVIQNELGVKVNEGLLAEATARSLLAATVSANTAAIASEAMTRATADSAMASQIDTLVAGVAGNVAAITTEATTRANADSALSQQITTLSSTLADNTAAIQNEATARADADTAMASQIAAVIAVSNSNTAAISSEASTRASEDDALSTRIDTVVADVGDAFALIQNETTARVAADNALAQQINTLGTEVDDNFATLTTNYYTKAQTDSAISSASTTLTSAYRAEDLAALNAAQAFATSGDAATLAAAQSYTGNYAYAKNNTYTKSEIDGSISSASTTLTAAYQSADAANAAAIQDEATARATADSSLATQISTLQSTVNGNTAAIQTNATTINGVRAQYTIKMDNNGFVSGYGLSSDLIDTGNAISRFYVNVNEFAVTTPTSSVPVWAASTAYAEGQQVRRADVSGKILICKQAGTSGGSAPSMAGAVGSMVSDGSVLWQVASAVPFAVLTTTQTINGTTLPPGTYIDGALIRNGTLNSAQIGTLAAEKISVGDLAADRIKANVIQAVNLSAQYIHADRIDTNTLTAKLAAIETAYIDEANITNGSVTNAKIGEFIQSNGYVSGYAGWRIEKSGRAEFQNIKVRGDVQATSLNAATGTFAGELSAASGTFAGQLLAGVLDLALAAGESHIYDQPGTYTFTVPEGMPNIRITCIGAGGGGGGGGARDFTGWYGGGGGGGGGSGSVVEGVYTNITPGTVLTIFVGTGGNGATGGFWWPGTDGDPGSDGQASYVSGYLTAAGGGGGGGGSGGDQYYETAPGGIPGTWGAQIGGTGTGAVSGVAVGGAGGAGGASGYGQAGLGPASNSTPRDGTDGTRGSGGGGGNGAWLNEYHTSGGGKGGNGLVIIEAYNPNSVVLQASFREFINENFNPLCIATGHGELVYAGGA